MPKVSIIVPVYNKAPYLKKCIESILNQTLSDIELILVNDGSKDNSEEICKEYLSDKRVKYFLQKNSGPATARQNGIDNAIGEYLGFIDADDWAEPKMFEIMYNSAVENCADIVMCNTVENENGRKFPPAVKNGVYDRQGVLNDILSKSLAFVNEYGSRGVIRWCNWLRIYKRSTIEKNNVRFDPRFFIGEDLQFTYEATLCAQKFVYLGDEYLHHNRVVEGSLSRGYNNNLWNKTQSLIELLYDVTENFKEADLLSQMHLRAFFFVSETIENEFKTDCPHNKKETIRELNRILKSPVCDRFIGQIEIQRLCEPLKKSYEAVENKDAESLYKWMKMYYRKTRRARFFRKKIRNPLVSFIKKLLRKK